MQNLDLWLEFVDTREIIPLFEKNAREYIIPKLTDVDWTVEPDYLVQIAQKKDFAAFKDLEEEGLYSQVFGWLLERSEKALLLQSFRHLLGWLRDEDSGPVKPQVMLRTMLDFLRCAPFLSVTFAQIEAWTALPLEAYEELKTSSARILQAHILSANEMQEFVVEPFKRVMSQIQSMSLADFADLVELISLTVCSSDIALNLLLECLERESMRILRGDPALIQHFVRSLTGIALDHIDEATQSQVSRTELLDLKLLLDNAEGYPVVECQLRIDAPAGGALALSDHVRLTTASSPTNSVITQKYSIDALVEFSEPGLAKFRCYHPLPPFFEQCSWELRNCGSFVTTKTMFDAVRTLATDKGCCGISGQILGTLEGSDNGCSLSPTRYTVKATLNASQNAAVETSLSHPLTCLWGPPGTGKTYTIVEIIKSLQESGEDRRMLVTAPTHNAVDNVMRKYLADVMKGRRLNDTAESIAIRVSTDVSLAVPTAIDSSNLTSGSKSSR